MICPNCGQETEPGKLCTNCGAPLPEEEVATATTQHANTAPNTADVQTQAPASGTAENEQPLNSVQNNVPNQAQDYTPDQAAATQDQSQNQPQEPAQPNEFVETLKRESANFGQFFLKMLKGPDEAKKINHTNMIPAIITMVIFSLFIALGSYLVSKQIGSMSLFSEVSFVDSFLIPLIQFIILFAVMIALVFGGAKMAAQSLTFKDAIGKFGAYTVPFLVLAIVGSLLTLIGLSVAGGLVVIGLLGPILIVPTFILLEKPTNGFDRIYVLMGIFIVALFVSGFLIQSVLSAFTGSMMGDIMGGF